MKLSHSSAASLLMFAVVCSMALFAPDVFAQTIPAFENAADRVLGTITGRLVITVAAIAIIAAAFTWYFGHINGRHLLLIIAATIIIPSAVALATVFYNVGSSFGG